MEKEIIYFEDILKNGFEQCKIRLEDDYEGNVESTLIRRKAMAETDKAVLYIHGFNDYFFQSDMAHRFNEQSCNFYALDLRKYGRSLLPHQKFNDCRDLKEYYEEIIHAIDIIKQEGNNMVTLMGHSTGGLILTLFAKDHSGSDLFDGLILNSPFFEFNKSALVRKLIPMISFCGKYIPSVEISGGFAKEYGEYLHKSYFGEWEYNLDWKPNIAPKVNLGWIRAIYEGQKELKKAFSIQQPTLVLHSARSSTDMKNPDSIRSTDTILNINHIDRISKNIKGEVKITPIKGGIHDLILSSENVRNHVYDTLFGWMGQHGLI